MGFFSLNHDGYVFFQSFFIAFQSVDDENQVNLLRSKLYFQRADLKKFEKLQIIGKWVHRKDHIETIPTRLIFRIIVRNSLNFLLFCNFDEFSELLNFINNFQLH